MRALAPIVALALLAASSTARAESLDWTDAAWAAGTLGPVTYTGATIPELLQSQVTIEVTDDDGAAPAGWPVIQSNISGFDESFRLRADFTTNADVSSPSHEFEAIDITFGAPVTSLQFDMGDLDTGSCCSPYSGWQDIVIVTGFFQGAEVAVAATPLGSAASVDTDGNDYSTALNASTYGRTGNVSNTSTAGNMRFTIAGPVDFVRVDYHPGSGTDFLPGVGPSNPNSQVIQLHDLIFVAQTDVSLAKAVDDPAPAVGQTVTYTLTVTNDGPSVATNLEVVDAVPAGLVYAAGTIAGGTTRDDSTTTALAWTIAALASGASTDLTFDAVVQAPTGAPDEYRNAAEVTALDQPDPDSAPDNDDGDQSEDDEAFVVVTPPSAADLSLAKSISDPTPGVGDTVTFTLTLANDGPQTASGVSVEDVLPVGWAYAAGTIAGGTTRDDSAAPTLGWTVASLAPGSAVELSFEAVAQLAIGAAGEYENVAQVTAAAQPDPDSTPANDDGDQSEDDEASLTVTPSAVGVRFAPDRQGTALPGSVIFYAHTFSASRDGTLAFGIAATPTPAIGGWGQALFRDLDCSATLDATEPVLAPAAVLPVTGGTPICVILRESVPPSAPVGAQDLVAVTASFTPSGPAAPVALTVSDLTTVTGPGGAGFDLRKEVDRTTAFPGDTVVYTITYTNQGSGPLTSLVIHDATPAFTTYVGGSALCGPLPPSLTACTPTAPAAGATGPLEWTFTGSLDPGQTGTVTYSVTVD